MMFNKSLYDYINYCLFGFLLFNTDTSWFTKLETCSKTCGKGSQSQSVVCRAKVNATHYNIDESEASCNATLKPNAEFRDCNNVKCPAKWTTSWSEVSKFGDSSGLLELLLNYETFSSNVLLEGHATL